MCFSLRALCIGGRRLFVLVLVFAADHAEQREADQRCQKAQADQCGRGRRRRGEIKDGHHHRQREEDFQKFGHWMGGLLFRRACKTAPVHLLLCSLVGRATRFPVNLSTGSLVRRSTCLPIYSSTCSRGSHSSAHGGENHGQFFDHARAFETLADDGQNGVVARNRAAEALGVVGVNFGRDARRIARTGAHHDQIARELHAQKTRGAEKFRCVERRGDLANIGRVLGQHIPITLLTRHLGGFELLEIARQRGLCHRVALGAQYLKKLFLTPDSGSPQDQA